jgi:hypothetical protein
MLQLAAISGPLVLRRRFSQVWDELEKEIHHSSKQTDRSPIKFICNWLPFQAL